MGKRKTPRKRRPPIDNEPPEGEKDVERQIQERGELVPPGRRPPTAVGAETPPPPPQEPPRPRPAAERRHPVLFRVFQAVRRAAGTIIDLADAAAEAITKRREGRA